MDEVKALLTTLEEQKTLCVGNFQPVIQPVLFPHINLYAGSLKKLNVSEEEGRKYSEIQEVIRQLDLRVLQPPNKPPTVSKKKKSRKHPENKEALMKDLEETAKQIDIVKEALSQIYEVDRTNFKKLVSKEGRTSRHFLNKRVLINRILEAGKTLPLWIGWPDEQPPSLCGGIQADTSYIAEAGDLVAALIGKNNGKNWILAEIIAYDYETQKYTVDDIDEDTRAEHIIKKEDVIPLPKMRANPECNREALIPEKSTVLALCPQTTCFYRGIVYEEPKGPHDPYKVLLEDSKYEDNYSPPISVDQRYVLNYRSSDEACVDQSGELHMKSHSQASDETEEEYEEMEEDQCV